MNVFLRKLLRFVKDGDRNLVTGVYYALALFILALFHSIVLHQYFDLVFQITAKFRLSLVHIIYKKVINLGLKKDQMCY